MCSLSSFPPPPLQGMVTLYEYESQLIASSLEDATEACTDQISMYPSIQLSGVTLRASVPRESAKNAFLDHTETPWKKAVIAWHEQGIWGVLGELSRCNNGSKLKKAISTVAYITLRVLHYVQSLHGSVFPHLLLSQEEMCKEFSPVLNWKTGTIKAFAWHPQTVKCAVALHDDTVRIYVSNNKMVPILKYWFQKGITDMAWKPFSASLLAVACQNGILLWHIDPSSLVSRPSSSCVRILKFNKHFPVTSIEWHPNSPLLVSASAADTVMIVWDVAMETPTPLRRVKGGGVSLLKWSPDGARLFAATPSSIFRVWETFKWTCEHFTNLLGRCHTACWSSDGSILLFATKGEPIIYSLSFSSVDQIQPHSVGGSKSAIPLIDLTQVTVIAGQEEIRVGGHVQMLAWDKTSERLAVTFKDNPRLIAVFRTRVKPVLEVSPCGFIRGLPGELPQLITFHSAFESGALLTVCWSSGRVSHIPFLFIPLNVSAVNCTTKFSIPPPLHRQTLLRNEQQVLYSTQ